MDAHYLLHVSLSSPRRESCAFRRSSGKGLLPLSSRGGSPGGVATGVCLSPHAAKWTKILGRHSLREVGYGTPLFLAQSSLRAKRQMEISKTKINNDGMHLHDYHIFAVRGSMPPAIKGRRRPPCSPPASGNCRLTGHRMPVNSPFGMLLRRDR